MWEGCLNEMLMKERSYLASIFVLFNNLLMIEKIPKAKRKEMEYLLTVVLSRLKQILYYFSSTKKEEKAIEMINGMSQVIKEISRFNRATKEFDIDFGDLEL